MKLFNKIGQGANKLFTKATQKNGLFDKFNEYARKTDNTLQRVGHFIRPIASHFGVGDIVKNGLNRIHDIRTQAVDTSNNLRNGLERAVKQPMNAINYQNYR